MGSGLIALQKPPGRQRTDLKQKGKGEGSRHWAVKNDPYCLLPNADCLFPNWSFTASLCSDAHWQMRAIKSNERLVPVSCTRCRASTSGLSTWWSSTALQGEMVLRLVSRLDAFSGYPFHI